jgi:hypothetical protein
VAGVKIGSWSSADDAIRKIAVKTVDRPIAGNPEIYADYFGIYQDLYPALKNCFERLSTVKP